MTDVATFRMLGVELAPLTRSELLTRIAGAIEERERLIVASQNTHSVYLHPRSAPLRALQSKSLMRIDGMPLILIARLLGYPARREHRTTWVDLIHPLMDRAGEEGWRVFYLGGEPTTLERGVEKLRQRDPALHLAGHHGYFDAQLGSRQNDEVLAQIARFEPDLVIVGMGMPRQERWILDNEHRVHAPVLMTSGAAIDYVAGVVRTPPRWMGRVGLEWLARLVEDPRRLAFRYLVEPWTIARRLAADLVAKYVRRREL